MMVNRVFLLPLVFLNLPFKVLNLYSCVAYIICIRYTFPKIEVEIQGT
jgi:hypothetical protein